MKTVLIVAVLTGLTVCSADAAISKWSENFEGYALGPITPYNASTYTITGTQWLWSHAVVTNIAAKSGSKSLMPHNTNPADANFTYFGRQIPGQFDKSIIKFSFMDISGGSMNVPIYIGDAGGTGPLYAYMQISQADGIRCWTPGNTNDGTVLVQPAAITSNVWHDVEVRADATTQQVAVVYDGQVVGQNIPFWRSGAFSGSGATFWECQNLGTSDSVLFDDIVLARVDDIATAEYLPADLSKDTKVNLVDLAGIAANWQKTYDTTYFESQITGRTYADSLPGYYVASMKGVNTSDQRFAQLGMYTFDGSGTVTKKYWNWIYNTTDQSALSDRTIGSAVQDSRIKPTDANKPIVSLASFLTGEGAMSAPLTGTYTRNGYDVVINFSDGSWEKWYQTWEELGNLYKMELYDASYLKAGSLCWITKSGGTWVRNQIVSNGDGTINIKNAGWMFGSNSRDFTYADTIASFWKDTNGSALDYDENTGQENLYKGGPRSPFNTYFVADSGSGSWTWYWTNNSNVIRRAMRDVEGPYPPTNFGDLFEYISAPASNPGITARRMIYQRSHDLNVRNGNIIDDKGQLFAGLQIIDNAGHYRGAVLVQNSYNPGSKAISGLFWIDSMFDSSRTAVRDKAVYAQNFDFTPGTQEYINYFPGWVDNNYNWVSWGDYGWGAYSGLDAATSTERYVSAPMSMRIASDTTLRYQSEAEIAGKSFFNYKLYMVGQGSTPVADYPEFGWANRSMTQQVYTNFVYMGTDKIKDVDVVPGEFKGVVTADMWHDIFWLLDATAHTTTLYVDGENRGTIAFYSGLMNPPPYQATKINAIQWACDPGFWITPTRYIDDFYFGQYPRNCDDAVKMGITVAGDLNGDCGIGFKDIHVFAQNWLATCADSTTWNCIMGQ